MNFRENTKSDRINKFSPQRRKERGENNKPNINRKLTQIDADLKNRYIKNYGLENDIETKEIIVMGVGMYISTEVCAVIN